MSRNAPPVIVVVALAALASGVVVSAGEDLEPPSPVLTVTGRAAIYHEDVPGARERAVRAALTRALERYAGLRIEASTLISKGTLVDREVRAHTHGWVRSFEVLDERRDGDELEVEVRVTVAEAPVEETFGRLVPATTTLLLAHETNLGRPVEGRILASILDDPFVGSELVVPPPETAESAAGRVPERFYGAPDPETARELGLRYQVGLLVVARAATTQLDTGPDSLGYEVDPAVLRPVVAAEGDVTVLDARSGRVLASRRFDDIRGSDASDPSRAGVEALHELAAEAKAFVVDALSRHVRELGFPLRVVVTGPQASDGAPRVRQILETTRWVESVALAEESSGRTVLEATCKEKPTYVVEELRQAPEIEITGFDAAAGEVEVE